MPDRTTKVTLTASVQGYISGMDAASKKTRELGTASEKLAAQKEGFTQVGRAALAIGAVAAAGVALAVKSFADFDAKMSQVKTLSHATADEMGQLTQAALHMGQAIGFSATEVADAEIELVKAGVSVKDIMGGALAGALQLAAAGQIDVADATEIATIALTQFSLKGKDVPHVADLLAAGADKALGGVGDLGEALKSGGLVAAQFGVSLDETIGTLSAFANAGLIGETAGTDLRQMLLKLANPAADAAAEMKKLGINIYDSSGQFVGINNLSDQLYKSMSNLTPSVRNAALATIFGSRAIAGANVLYKEGQKGDGIKGWTEAVSDSGFAAKQAAGKMDNLKGDLSKLEAAFNTNLIQAGSAANDILRGLVQGLTGVTSAVGDLPQPVLAAGLGLTALVAIVGLTGGAALIGVPKIVAFKASLDAMNVSGRSAAIGVGVASAALAAAAFAFALWAASEAKAKAAASEFADSLDKTTGAVTKYSRELVAKNLADGNAFKAAKAVGISQKELTDAVINGGAALDNVKDKIGGNTAIWKLFSDQGWTAATALKAISDEADGVKTGTKNFKDLTAATGENADSTETAAEAYKAAADKVSTMNTELTDLIDTINKANGVGQDAVSANADYKKALDDVAEAVKTAKGGIDESTTAGSANAAMLADLAAKGEDAATKQFALDNNTDSYTKALQANHDAVYNAARAMGATADQAQALADKVAAIPSQKAIQILANTAQAAKTIDDFIAAMGQKVGTIMFRSQLTDLNGKVSGSGRMGTFGSGGYTGNISPTAVAGVVHGREFVNDEKSTAKPANRAAMEFMNAGGDISNYKAAVYAPAPIAAPVQYMQAPSNGTTQHISITAPAIETQDASVYGAILGREFGRRVAG